MLFSHFSAKGCVWIAFTEYVRLDISRARRNSHEIRHLQRNLSRMVLGKDV